MHVLKCMLLCALMWDRLPRTTCTAASPQQRWSTHGFQAAYQTTDPHWDGPEKETNNILYILKKVLFHKSISVYPPHVLYQV